MSPPSQLERTMLRAPASTQVDGSGAPELSPDELASARQRLLGWSLVIGGTMFAYFLLYRTVWESEATHVGQWVAPGSVLLFAALGGLAFHVTPTRRRLAALAMAFHVVLRWRA